VVVMVPPTVGMGPFYAWGGPLSKAGREGDGQGMFHVKHCGPWRGRGGMPAAKALGECFT